MLIDLYTKDGEKSGQVELLDEVFAIEPNENAMYQAVVAYLKNNRQGTRKTKTRAEVSGGGKKPWRQKGRGTARAGSNRSPIWVGGGTIHGPQPQDFNYSLSKKVKRLARKSAFTERCLENNLLVVEDFSFDEIKTNNMANVLKNLDIEFEKVLLLLPQSDETIYLSSRNIPGLSVYAADKISTYDILNHKKLVIFKGALEVINKTFAS
ncbi:MAG: large subunit ribosomal protein [Bacteroidota bacterium]|nr:large subunit ribosomal protein [Bacteroidota bacterium]